MDDLRERLDRRAAAVLGTTAVVRYDDRIDTATANRASSAARIPLSTSLELILSRNRPT